MPDELLPVLPHGAILYQQYFHAIEYPAKNDPIFNFQNAHFSEPDFPDYQLCGAIDKDGKWKSYECDLEKEFTCKLKSCKF